MKYIIENKELRATFSTKGAELLSLIDLASGIDFIWSGDATYWNRHAPVLFPIVGRLKDDKYTHAGQEYPSVMKQVLILCLKQMMILRVFIRLTLNFT